MKQKGDKSNNFQIGKAGTGNTFNVNQNSRYFRDEAVQLLKRNSSHQSEITNNAVTRRSLITLLSATLPLIGFKTMPTLEEIKQMIFQLPIQEQITLMEDLEEKLETLQMMQLAETGFMEWNDEEEDIYDA